MRIIGYSASALQELESSASPTHLESEAEAPDDESSLHKEQIEDGVLEERPIAELDGEALLAAALRQEEGRPPVMIKVSRLRRFLRRH